MSFIWKAYRHKLSSTVSPAYVRLQTSATTGVGPRHTYKYDKLTVDNPYTQAKSWLQTGPLQTGRESWAISSFSKRVGVDNIYGNLERDLETGCQSHCLD